jgi:hypothetical protein
MNLKERYQALSRQGYLCACCKDAEIHQLGTDCYADFSPTTGRFRGILCCLCYRGLQCFQDNSGLLEQAIKYLQNYQGDL